MTTVVSELQVKKRNGQTEDYNPNKINDMLIWATEGLSGVSPSDIAFNAQLNLRDNIPTSEIQLLLVKSANDLISQEHPNYQYAAARLLLIGLRKDVWGNRQPPKLIDHIRKNVKAGVYDDALMTEYTAQEINKIETYIKHSRDEQFTYAGLQQFVDKYLLKNRSTGEIYETPQFAYMCLCMIVAQNEPQEKRLRYIKQLYDYFSTFKINLPTPILAGVRTKIRQFSSCILIDCDDSLDSIFTSAAIAGKYTARRAGIGINMGRIRPIGSQIRHGEVIHTGIIPYMKVMESAVKSTSQNGIRGGSATVSIPWWHYEIEDVMQLKNNGGTDDNRVRKLDYCVQFEEVFYKALVNDDYVYLFSSDECPELYETFGTPEFAAVYETCSKKRGLRFKKKVKAATLAAIFARERLETGRIYSMNIDHCNQGGCWDAPVKMTNLCVEITQPTVPCSTEFTEDGRIGVCTLGAINVLEIKDDDDLATACELLVRTLDFIIGYQDYPFEASRLFAQRTRSLGIGVTNLAAWLACNKTSYNDEDAPKKAAELMEAIQYHCLSASCTLAREKGACEDFHLSKYSKGQLPIDWYNRHIDEVIGTETHHDWEALRLRIKDFGLRNCSVSAQMPCESSSVIQNATNGVEPVRSLMSFKKAKNGKLKQLVPKFSKYKNYYDLAFTDVKNESIIKVSAAMQKWIDMAMSTNLYYNYDEYDGGIIPLSVIIKDHLVAYKLGIKNLYYANTPDGDNEAKPTCDAGGCTL